MFHKKMVCVYRQVGFISSDNSLGEQLTELCDCCGARKKYNWEFDSVFDQSFEYFNVLDFQECLCYSNVS